MNGTPTVQLRHDLPDGQWHVDWMLARDHDPGAELVTFRLENRLDGLPSGTLIPGTRLADHRRTYLQFEGPLSDDRGHVQRLAEGCISKWVCHGDEWWINIRWNDGPSQIIRVRVDGASDDCQVYVAESSLRGSSS